MSMGATANEKKTIAALIVLSLFWALDGLAPDLFPALRRSAMPATERQAITFALFSICAAVFAVMRRRNWPSRQHALLWAATGVLMFAAPALLTLAVQTWVSQLERVAIFSLTPVMAAVLEAHIGLAAHRSSGALLASLTAVAGALAIFPLTVPATPAATLALLIILVASACAAVGNCVAVRLAHSAAYPSIAACASCMCAASAVTFAVASACGERARWQFLPSAMQVAWLVLFDLPPIFLLIRLLSRMSATRMTARFVLAPLFTVLVGIALEQPQITTRMIIGIALLAAGAAWLLLANESDESADLIRLT